MIQLYAENLFKISKKHGISEKDLITDKKSIDQLLKKIHQRKQGFYEIIDDSKLLTEIEDFSKKATGKYQSIVVLGIGGSALGTICLQQSLKHLFASEIKQKTPHLYVLDNIDPTLIKEVEDVIDLKKTLFLVITKSGTTPETLAQYQYFRAKIEKIKLKVQNHFVFITDPEKGTLREIAKKEKIPSFEIPENVGGRFSVLTAVGLLPAQLIGIDIRKLIKGAKQMRDQFLDNNYHKNIAFILAKIQFLLSKKNKSMTVLMPYAQKLIRFADWYRQLLAESIGKKYDNKNKIVHSGITPINALGVTDQHSQSQLYNEGPNDKFIIFLEVQNLSPELKIPGEKFSFNKLIQVEKNATADSLTSNDRPNITIKINSINEETLGELLMLFEGSIAFLGELFNINAFDQPGVELSKVLTKKYLQK